MFILDSVPAHSALQRATTASDGTRFETYYPLALLDAHNPLVWVYVKVTYASDAANPVWHSFGWSTEDYREYLALLSEAEAEIEAETEAETEADDDDYEY